MVHESCNDNREIQWEEYRATGKYSNLPEEYAADGVTVVIADKSPYHSGWYHKHHELISGK
jgi:hypothetical protein